MNARIVKIASVGMLSGLLSTASCRKSAEESDESSIRAAEALTSGSKDMPQSLGETSLFVDGKPNAPIAGLTRYDIVVPFWSDGADKTRYLFMPQDAQLKFNKEKSEFDFPVGTTFVKHFKSGAGSNSDVETRVITLKDDGKWRFASYIWQDDGSSKFNNRPVTVKKDDRDFRVPSESECKQCHGEQSPILGFSPAQIKLEESKPNNALKNLREKARTEVSDGDLETFKAAVDPRNEALTNKERTRAYFQANCSFCHNPGGLPGADKLDLRMEATDTKLLATKKVVPGDLGKSILWKKISGDADRMPSLSLRTDPLALEIIRTYIEKWED